MMNQERNISLDVARILACLGVITIHVSGGPVVHGYVAPDSIGAAICTIIDACVRWSVPMFVMISGYFFLGSEKPVKTIYSKYVLRLVLSLIFWALFYALILHWNFYPFDKVSNHFWFIGMMIGLYISIPVLRPIAQNNQLLRYACWTWVALEVYKFAGRYVALPVDITDFVFTDYVGYFLWGYYLRVTTLSHNHKIMLCAAAIVGLLCLILVPVLTDDRALFNYESPAVFASTIGLFYLFTQWKIACGVTIQKVICALSAYSFGIYMVHMFWLVEVFSRIHRFIQSPILEVPICIITVFVLSMLTTMIIKKIPYINKYIV